MQYSSVDIAIVGGGLSGLLLACRLLHFNPDLRIIILEKENYLGGKLRTFDNSCRIWGYGLNCISEQLYNFWNETLKSKSYTKDLYAFNNYSPSKLQILIGSNLYNLAYLEVLESKFVKILGGKIACTNLDKFKHILKHCKSQSTNENILFKNLWSGIKKDPFTIALHMISNSIGIYDIWLASVKDWIKRVETYFYRTTYRAAWNKALEYVEEILNQYNGCKVCKASLVVEAYYDEHKWTLISDKGKIESKILVVAHDPWLALSWLPQKYWPKEVLRIALKTQPTSSVVLTETILNHDMDLDIADMMFIPSEKCHAVLSDNKEISFQQVLDYETSFQAPDVVKAVKALKRAKRKFIAYYGNILSDLNNIALISSAWATPYNYSELRLLSDVKKDNLATDNLVFCGETYGTSVLGDDNMIFSIINAETKIHSLFKTNNF